MRTTPYELVFGQPPRQNIFPGVHGTKIMEEDVEDILQNSPDAEMTREFDADCSPEPKPSPKTEMKFDADGSPEPFDADRSPEPEMKFVHQNPR